MSGDRTSGSICGAQGRAGWSRWLLAQRTGNLLLLLLLPHVFVRSVGQWKQADTQFPCPFYFGYLVKLQTHGWEGGAEALLVLVVRRAAKAHVLVLTKGKGGQWGLHTRR